MLRGGDPWFWGWVGVTGGDLLEVKSRPEGPGWRRRARGRGGEEGYTVPGPYFSETLVDCPQTDAGGKTSLCQSFERERKEAIRWV